MSEHYGYPRRHTRNTISPFQMQRGKEILQQTGGLMITPKALCLLNQVQWLCSKEGVPNTGKNARCIEIVHQVQRVIEANPAMVEVWFDWCRREDVALQSKSAVEAFDKLYQAALQ